MCLMAVIVLFVVYGWGQPSRESFAVAAIKLVDLAAMDARQIGFRPSAGGRFSSISNLRNLILYAHDAKDYQLGEGPAWTRSEYYSVEAATGDDRDLTLGQVRQLLRNMLQDRFKLSLQVTGKETSVYRIVPGNRGPKFSESAPGTQFKLSISSGRLTTSKITMARLAQTMSGFLDRPVVDASGLTGEYDVTLTGFEIDFMPLAQRRTSLAESDGLPSIFQSIQDDLGLKLESTRETVEIFTIDKVERPTEN